MSNSKRISQRGIVYAITLLLSAMVGVFLLAIIQNTQLAMQREKEAQLLYVGSAIATAIKSYRSVAPGLKYEYPVNLEALLADKRFIRWPPRRHLRKIYYDPMTNSKEWGLIYDEDEKIKGVYSLSTKKPIKTSNFPASLQHFNNKVKYSDWKFIYE